MDRRERYDDGVEAVRAALDGRLAEVWTALPGVVQSFDSVALTVSVQPAIKGRVARPDGSELSVTLPLLVDVPVVFPRGGGFTLTFPVAAGDECLVVFAARCIDSWWQSGGIGEPLETRQHDLSDGFALVGPFSQAQALDGVNAEDVQLRHDDGQAFVAIKPDHTIQAQGPAASVTLTPAGEVATQADAKITLRAPLVEIAADSFSLASLAGGAAAASMTGALTLTGTLISTGDQVAAGISQTGHVHNGVTSGSESTGGPQ